MNFIYFLPLILLFIYLLWRFHYFFRDPERKIPSGKNIVSVADGTVVYIRKINNGEIPISIKKRRIIKLTEVAALSRDYFSEGENYIVGVFMHPTSVHVNRAPISGRIAFQKYINNRKNLPMTAMWFRTLLRQRPYELYSEHILENERNIIQLVGDIPITIIQIADIYVNKIDTYVAINDEITKGKRIGMIKMGSQVDIIFPAKNVKLEIHEGQKVLAGESIIATY